MAIKSKDKLFRLPKITLLDFKTVEMDRVLTLLCARLYHQGNESRLGQSELNTVEKFVSQFLEKKDRFHGFDRSPEILRGWVETHLLDLVNRGRATQQVAAPRPLHGFTYRFRNPKHCRDYSVSAQIYEMLDHARNDQGKLALSQLKQFFFEGVDQNTGALDAGVEIDVETQALLNAVTHEDMVSDAAAKGSREVVPPLCIGSADLLANDVIRLMVYRRVIPRSAMVDYLKILFAFHLALYHLRLLKLLPALVKAKGIAPSCQRERCPVLPLSSDRPQGDCPWRVNLFVDVQGTPGTRSFDLSAQSAEDYFRRIPAFIRAHFLVKKLDEFGQTLLQLGRLPGGGSRQLSIWEVLQLLGDPRTADRDQFFLSRLMGFTEEQQTEEGSLDPEIQQVLDLKLPSMDAYIECLVAMRMNYHRKYLTASFDSLTLKNRPGALMAQARAPKAPRRFVLDSRLLEVLLQLAVLQFRDGAFRSEEIRVDELLVFLRERYGLHIDMLPPGEGFGEQTIEDREALRQNKNAFKAKLREIGFFQDLSDAYITQHVTPRYRLGGGSRA